ncbi:hypothetical protein DSL72_003851 [Monilinia vaccinii-corymbosi]|uniref:Uncharacterized protein n=1 Tax=Monilinia vaccinii-corymbosi TaxID=61207 RepID=A0A8A3P9E4_9HELO|nr:hypothetical protein DSL72_003851 [Monilinia vaccinii-corymbosi]
MSVFTFCFDQPVDVTDLRTGKRGQFIRVSVDGIPYEQAFSPEAVREICDIIRDDGSSFPAIKVTVKGHLAAYELKLLHTQQWEASLNACDPDPIEQFLFEQDYLRHLKLQTTQFAKRLTDLDHLEKTKPEQLELERLHLSTLDAQVALINKRHIDQYLALARDLPRQRLEELRQNMVREQSRARQIQDKLEQSVFEYNVACLAQDELEQTNLEHNLDHKIRLCLRKDIVRAQTQTRMLQEELDNIELKRQQAFKLEEELLEQIRLNQ